MTVSFFPVINNEIEKVNKPGVSYKTVQCFVALKKWSYDDKVAMANFDKWQDDFNKCERPDPFKITPWSQSWSFPPFFRGQTQSTFVVCIIIRSQQGRWMTGWWNQLSSRSFAIVVFCTTMNKKYKVDFRSKLKPK